MVSLASAGSLAVGAHEPGVAGVAAEPEGGPDGAVGGHRVRRAHLLLQLFLASAGLVADDGLAEPVGRDDGGVVVVAVSGRATPAVQDGRVGAGEPLDPAGVVGGIVPAR